MTGGWTERYDQEPIVAAPPGYRVSPPDALMPPRQPHLDDPALLAEWFKTLERTIAIDFDGTLHPYTKHWIGSTPDDELPLPGAWDAVRDLQALGYRIVIFSVRADHPEGLAGIAAWLTKHGFTGCEITHLKPPAIAYIEDRAVGFRGDWHAAVEEALGIAHGTIPAAAPARAGHGGEDALRGVTLLNEWKAPDVPPPTAGSPHALHDRYLTDPLFHALVNVVGMSVDSTMNRLDDARRVQAIYDLLDSTDYEIATKSEHVGYWSRDGHAVPLSALPKTGPAAQAEFLAYHRPLFAHNI